MKKIKSLTQASFLSKYTARTLMILIALILNLISLVLHITHDFLLPDNLTFAATLTWLFSVLLIAIVFLFFIKNKKNNIREKLSVNEILLFIIILIIALILRIFKIKNQALYLDEWYWITTAKDILNRNIFSPFGFVGDQPSNMPAFLVSLLYLITHDVYYAVRLPGVLYSIGTICFLFAFLKMAFNKRVAYISALLLATSIWDIHMSQLGWNNVTVNPFLISGTIYFLFQAIKYKSYKYAFLTGLFIGISVNLLYIAALSIIPVVFVLLYSFLFKNKNRIFACIILIIAFTTYITASPTIVKIFKYPDQSVQRHEDFLKQNIDNSHSNKGAKYYLAQVSLAIQDMKYDRTKYSDIMLWGITIEPVILILFIFGILVLLRRITRIQNQILLFMHIVMFIPVVVMYRFTSIWREYGFIPTIYSITALGASLSITIILQILHRFKLSNAFTQVFIYISLFLIYLFQWTNHFYHYYKEQLRSSPNNYELTCKKTAEYINTNLSTDYMLIFDDTLCSTLTMLVLDDKYDAKYLNNSNFSDSKIANSKKKALIIFKYDQSGNSTSAFNPEVDYLYNYMKIQDSSIAEEVDIYLQVEIDIP